MNRVVRLVEVEQVTEVTDGEDEIVVREEQGDPSALNAEHLRMAEAILFAASQPLDEKALATSLPDGANLKAILAELQSIYEQRGVNLVCIAEKWQFRTAPDLAFLLRKEQPEQKRLSRAAIETLAIVAYHQPVTRAEIEDIRGVMLSKGTIDALMEVGWVKIRGRKRTPGRPVTYGTTEAFPRPFRARECEPSSGYGRIEGGGLPRCHSAVRLRRPQPHRPTRPRRRPLRRRRRRACHRQRRSARCRGVGVGSRVLSGRQAAICMLRSACLIAGLATGPAYALDTNENHWCRNGLFPSEQGPFSLMRVSMPNAAMNWDGGSFAGCPQADRCKRNRLQAGQTVIADNRMGRFVCVYVANKAGGDAGWVFADDLKPSVPQPSSNPPLHSWSGDWLDRPNRMAISVVGSHLVAHGKAWWQGLSDPHFGNFSATAKPEGARVVFDDGSCRVIARLAAQFLIAYDNEKCGGMNVRFDGVYMRSR
jgi:segregation and condensation protein B